MLRNSILLHLPPVLIAQAHEPYHCVMLGLSRAFGEHCKPRMTMHEPNHTAARASVCVFPLCQEPDLSE